MKYMYLCFSFLKVVVFRYREFVLFKKTFIKIVNRNKFGSPVDILAASSWPFSNSSFS